MSSVTPVHAVSQVDLSTVTVQNTGLTCAFVRLDFRRRGQWEDVTTCHVFALSPGEAYAFDASDCVGPDWRGSVVVQSTEPLAIVHDLVRGSSLRSLPALLGWSPFDFNGDGRVDAADVAVLEAALGTSPGQPAWYVHADLDGDGDVDATDREILMGELDAVQPTGTASPTVMVPTAVTGTATSPTGGTPTMATPTPTPTGPSPTAGTPTASVTPSATLPGGTAMTPTSVTPAPDATFTATADPSTRTPSVTPTSDGFPTSSPTGAPAWSIYLPWCSRP
jgi:hypothetical protein